MLPAFAPAQPAAEADRATNTTSGEAVIYVTPDEVTLSLGIEAFDARLENAKAELDRNSKALLAAIKEAGVEAANIQTAAVEVEVRAVSALSERIDALVTELNAARDEQAKRLVVLDELRLSVGDDSLGAFLNQTIQPRTVRVREVVPERLRED